MNHFVALRRESAIGASSSAARQTLAMVSLPSLLSARVALALVFCICALDGATAAQAQRVYRDPAGNFTVQVPQGWQTQPQDNNGISVVNEQYKASVSVFVMRGPDSSTPSAEKQLADIRKQVQGDCPNANLQTGDSNILGLHGKFLIAGCHDNSGDEVLKFAVVSGPGVMVILNTAAPQANLGTVGQTLVSIERSVTLGSGSASSSQPSGDSRQLAALKRACSTGALDQAECDQRMAKYNNHPDPPASDNRGAMVTSNDPNFNPNAGPSEGSGRSGMYRDNQGRYSLVVPDGWSATPETDGSGTLQLSRGNAWATVALMEGAGDSASKPVDIAHGILQEMQPQYQQAELVSEGDFESNRHAAHGSNATGIDSHGAHVSVTVISIQARGLNFLSVVSSAPESQADEINSQILEMVKSIRFAGE
ncbi:MAG TPA: hypothetical protein VK574_13000 [Terracidiphilus sp.]|nr:hypothetical protein [Terracidiphilus sp.]